MNEIVKLRVRELSEALENRSLSATEVTLAYLKHIETTDEQIGAYLTVCADFAIQHANRIDKLRADGERMGPLAGIPMALKDNLCTEGIRTSCASKMLENFIPPYSATVYERLQEQGAVLLGKLNMDEFGMGATTENSAFRVTHNPCNRLFSPGGSSGGAAAAVASGEAAFAIGSDTGGSIRQPASFCGVVGMKPTYGRVSRNGLIAFASSLDHIGPITKDVYDNALILNAIAGRDARDATSSSASVPDFTAEIGRSVKGLRIALPENFSEHKIEKEVKESVLYAANIFAQLGAEIVELALPSSQAVLSAYYVLSSAEASSNLSRYDGIRYGYRTSSYSDLTDLYCNSRSEGFGEEVKRRILLGTFALSAGCFEEYYQKASSVRDRVKQDFETAFASCDLILSPVSPVAGYLLNGKKQDPVQMYLSDLYTVPANLAGLPALSVPCGRGAQNLPIGIQLIAPAFGESLLYRAGYALEQEVCFRETL